MAYYKAFVFFILTSFIFCSISLTAGDIYVRIDTPDGKTSICQGQRFVLVTHVDDYSIEEIEFAWVGDVDKLEVISEQLVSVNTKTPGVFEFEYKVWNDDNDTGSAFVRITVLPVPDSEISSKRRFFTRLFRKEFPVIISLKNNKDIESIEWYKNREIIENNISNIRVNTPGSYRAKVVSKNGCVSFSNTIEIN